MSPGHPGPKAPDQIASPSPRPSCIRASERALPKEGCVADDSYPALCRSSRAYKEGWKDGRKEGWKEGTKERTSFNEGIGPAHEVVTNLHEKDRAQKRKKVSKKIVFQRGAIWPKTTLVDLKTFQLAQNDM